MPAYFNDAQRTATRDAGRLAGLEVLRIINEPTAACLAYGLDQKAEGVIAVYDLGGGTFDVSILKVEEGVFQVLATNGDTHLGGDDIDQLFIRQIAVELAVDPRVHPEAIQSIRKGVIQAKWDLSDLESTEIRIGALPGHPDGYTRAVTRSEFEQIIAPVVQRTLAPCRQALEDAGLRPDQVDDVVLVGGYKRITMVLREV